MIDRRVSTRVWADPGARDEAHEVKVAAKRPCLACRKVIAGLRMRTGDMIQPIKLLVVDDHRLIRDMLCALLSREPDMDLVGSAGDADQAVGLARQTRPDIVVMDIEMPGRFCFDAARAMQAIRPSTRVIFLTALTNDLYVEQAMDVGAAGYVTKNEPPTTLLAAIRSVAAGGSFYSDAISQRMEEDESVPRLTRASSSSTRRLTRREIEVLRYIARSMSEEDIATTMHLSRKTVHCHTTNLKNKLGIHRAVQLARFAIREGLAEP